MASRRGHRTRRSPELQTAPPSDDGFDFLASQQSNGSDDPALELAIAQHYAAIREKKKKENEQKFLKAAQKQLSRDVSTVAGEVTATMATIENLFAEFLLQYAACEDNIRNLWSQVHKEQTKLAEFSQVRLSANIEASQKIEDTHIDGLSCAKDACHDIERIIKHITPQGF